MISKEKIQILASLIALIGVTFTAASAYVRFEIKVNSLESRVFTLEQEKSVLRDEVYRLKFNDDVKSKQIQSINDVFDRYQRLLEKKEPYSG